VISRDASDRCWPISREQKVTETPKYIGKKVAHPRAIMHTNFKVKGTRPTNADTESASYPPNGGYDELRMPTNFKLDIQMEHEDAYDRQAP